MKWPGNKRFGILRIGGCLFGMRVYDPILPSEQGIYFFRWYIYWRWRKGT